jgi:hypothetical protein
MEILMTSRGGGKTYYAVQELRSNPNAILIVPIREQREQILRRYKYRNIEKRIIAASDTFSINTIRHIVKEPVFIFDNVEACLSILFGGNTVLITTSIEDRLPDSVYVKFRG